MDGLLLWIPNSSTSCDYGICWRCRPKPGNLIRSCVEEYALARTGWMVGSQFVFSQKCKSMRNVGISDERVAAIPTWSSSTCFTALQRQVLAYTEDLIRRGTSRKSLRAALKESLSDVAVLELTFIVTTYIGSSIICQALHLEYDNRDDPVVEVPAPTGAPRGWFDRMHNDIAGLDSESAV